MSSVRDKVGDGGLLHGSDVVKAKKKSVAGVVLQVRDASPGFNAPYVVVFDCDVLPSIHEWACNTTQARRLASMIDNQTENWEGWMIQLGVVRANNPTTGKEVDSLEVVNVMKPAEVKTKRKTKPVYKKSSRSESEPPAWATDEVPF